MPIRPGQRLIASAPLQLGDELRCPHCRAWHPVVRKHEEGTDYTRAMLYWQCRGRGFYAGQVGGSSRYETRHRPNPGRSISTTKLA
jgi:hypothetical protein